MMKLYLISALIGSIAVSTAFVLLISGQNLGEDFYRIEMIDGAKVEVARLDQFALFISVFAAQIFAVLTVPVLALRALSAAAQKLKIHRSRGDAR